MPPHHHHCQRFWVHGLGCFDVAVEISSLCQSALDAWRVMLDIVGQGVQPKSYCPKHCCGSLSDVRRSNKNADDNSTRKNFGIFTICFACVLRSQQMVLGNLTASDTKEK